MIGTKVSYVLDDESKQSVVKSVKGGMVTLANGDMIPIEALGGGQPPNSHPTDVNVMLDENGLPYLPPAAPGTQDDYIVRETATPKQAAKREQASFESMVIARLLKSEDELMIPIKLELPSANAFNNARSMFGITVEELVAQIEIDTAEIKKAIVSVLNSKYGDVEG